MSGTVRSYGPYEIYNDDESEFTVKCPDDSRYDYPTLNEAKRAVRQLMLDHIHALEEQVKRLDHQLLAEHVLK